MGRVCSSCHMVNSLKQCCVFRAADRHLWLSMGPFMKLDTVSTIALSIGTGCLSEPAATAVQFLALQMLRMKPRRLCIGGKHFQQSYRLPPLTLIFQPPLIPTCWEYRLALPHSASLPSCWEGTLKPTSEHCRRLPVYYRLQLLVFPAGERQHQCIIPHALPCREAIGGLKRKKCPLGTKEVSSF